MKPKHKIRLFKLTRQIFFFILILLSFFKPLFADDEDFEKVYKIAVLAYKGKAIALKQWAAHEYYLNQKLAPLKFKIIPLTYTQDELAQAVLHRKVDFVITNPAQYIELELGGHVSRLATRRIACCGTILDQFGGTAITLAKRNDINDYADLKDKKIIIPSRHSLGGWQVHLREGLKHELDFRVDAQISELKNHKKVVQAILAEQGDVGFVRSGLLEKMLTSGEIPPNQLKVINLQHGLNYPYQLSTVLYPEWPIAAVTGTASVVSVHVLQALLKMPPNDKAATAAGIYGWTIAGHYSSVNDLFREAGIGIYAPEPLTVSHMLFHYKNESLLIVVLLTLILVLFIKGKRNNTLLQRNIEQLEQIKKQLKQSEQRLELAMQVSHEGIWDWDLKKDAVFFNAGYYTIAGYEPEEFPYCFSEWRKRVHPDDLHPAECALAQYLAGESPCYDIEFRFLCKDQSYIWIRARGEIVAYDTQGNPLRVVGTHADISEYHQMSEQLTQSELLKNNILKTIPDLVWLKDIDGIYLACNPLFEQFFGKKEADIIGKSDYDFVDKEKADFFREHDLAAIDADNPVINDEWITFAGSEEKIFLETTKSPLKSKKGELLGVLGIGHDITHRKIVEKKLIKSEKSLAQAQHLSQMGSWHLDIINKTLTWSAETYRILEIDQDSVSPTYELFLEQIHPEDRERVNKTYLDSLEHMMPYNIEHRFLMKDGRVKYVNERCETSYNLKGEPLRSLGSVLDITERIHSEQQLIEARQAADSANRLKSEFLANMSHEIRTPMNAILGFTDILKSMETDAKKSKYLHTIQTSGNSLLNLINDILDLSKIESGKMELNYRALSLKSLLIEIEGLFLQKTQEKGLVFEYKINDCIPDRILFDESRLRQVLVNLISNAVKFTHQGFIKIHIGCESPEKYLSSHVNLAFSISDSGIGIPKNQQQKIFNSFSQVKGQQETLYGGTGLGLTITKRIIDLVKGTIELESEVGVGTRFSLLIPNIEVAAGILETETVDVIDIETIHFETAKLLIADDVEYNRELLATYLADWDFELFFAENGQQAIEKAESLKPDLILLDMKMPIMDGYEASEKLKAQSHTAKIPIIAVTAFALNQDEEKIRNVCDGYLRKPVNKQGLIKELIKFLPHTVIEKEQPLPNQTDIISPLTKEIILSLPEKLKSDLKHALVCVDIEAIEKLLKEIAEKDAQLSEAIQQKVDDFEYERLLELFN